MEAQERADVWSVPHLNGLNLLRATFITYAFKRHMHDYFVIGLIEAGVQKFSYQRKLYVTPPTGIIVINPGEAHTGEAAIPSGFHYRAMYPEADVMQGIASEIRGRRYHIPFFAEPVMHDLALFEELRALHAALEQPGSMLEHESRTLWALAHLIERHAGSPIRGAEVKREKTEIKRLRAYLTEHYTENIRLSELADLVHWNAYYLLRAFRNEVGLPPHAYLESIRIRAAQQMLKQGMPIAQAAYDTGFSSQSHFTTTFKRLIGVTPGHYARQVNFLKDRGAPSDLS